VGGTVSLYAITKKDLLMNDDDASARHAQYGPLFSLPRELVNGDGEPSVAKLAPGAIQAPITLFLFTRIILLDTIVLDIDSKDLVYETISTI
jgi:hypothetical protein